MTVIAIDLENFGSIIAGLITLSAGIYTYLKKLGYIDKWKTKLSIDDDVANAATTVQSTEALLKLSIPDELITVFKEIAADKEGGIDAQRIIDILNDRSNLEKILGSDKPLTKEEKNQISCIMLRAMKAYKKENSVTAPTKQ